MAVVTTGEGRVVPPPGALDDRRILGQGTPERAWRAWPGLARIPAMSLRDLAPPDRRVVVVSPHPDDEVLGCGGTLASLSRLGREILLVAVTDGEACDPGSARSTPEALGRERARERLAGLSRLGVSIAIDRLRLPDGGVERAQPALADHLLGHCRPTDVLLAPWRFDGHPDHEAVGRAASEVAARLGATCHEMPIWAWHWARPGDARVPWRALRRVDLTGEALRHKREAIGAHASQLLPRAGRDRDPVLPGWALARLLRPFETFFVESP